MRHALSLFLTLLLLAAAPAPAAAAGAGGPTDPAELAAFVDPIFARHLKEHNIPGAVFVVVKDGKVLLQKGYGVADHARQTPIDPERTLFSIGSVTKLFTGTAVMQQVEQGKIDLHADINQYLKEFQIPATYPEPITMAHLLTHTAGFDESVLGMAARTEAEVEPLGRYLARTLPARIRPPGQEHQYSNHGISLAAHIVEQVTGIRFDQYVEEHIFRPLGMRRTTMGLPPELAPDLATHHVYLGGRYLEEPVWHLHLAPAGSIKATGADMARFMIAHLQRGRYENVRIHGEDFARQMQQQQFTHHPRLPGMTYTFMERFRSGQRAIEHGGDVAGMSSLLLLVPEGNWGFFVSYNANAGGKVRDVLAEALLDHYASEKSPPAPAPPADFAQRAAQFTGAYQPNRYERTTLLKLQQLSPGWRVSANADGTLTISWPGGLRPPVRLVEVEPLLFQQVGGNGYHYAFKADEQGQITHLYLPFYSLALERVEWHMSYPLHNSLIGVALLLALTALVGWPLGALIRRLRKRPALPAEVRRARWAAAALALLIPLFMVGMLSFMTRPLELVFGLPPILAALLVLPYLTAALAMPVLWFAIRSWKSDAWTLAGRLHYSAIALSSTLFVAFLWYWNLLF
ncbi:MAG: serine hydrolase domain-containing protein [Bacillota bacterium]